MPADSRRARRSQWKAAVALATSLALAASGAAASAEPFPRPPGLEPAVQFWVRIYSEIDTRGGLLHDAEHLDVVYEKLAFPEGLSQRARRRTVKRRKRHYEAILGTLAAGKRSGLSAEERHVLALWPDGVSRTTLRRAARNVRFQLGQADKFRDGLIRSGIWIPDIRRVLGDAGVPLELAALPHVESSFNPRAYSRVGAAGLWQFTRSTGRRFLRIDYVVDERLDPLRSTQAAARLLLENHEKTGTWPLAITAYNHGAAGVLRAVRELDTRDIVTIVRRYEGRTFGFASRNFYAEFLAALDVEQSAEEHFGPLVRRNPSAIETVLLDHYYSAETLARTFGVSVDTLQSHNPALRSPVWDGQKYVPEGFALQLPPPAQGSPSSLLARVGPSQRHGAQRRDDFYRVRRGDTLSEIARRFGLRQAELVSANGLRSRHWIRAGMVLRIPRPGGGATLPDGGLYRVRRGDTLSRIASRFGLSIRGIASRNGLRDADRIRAGQVLELAAGGTRVADAGEPAPAARDETVEPDGAGEARAAAAAAPAGSVYTVKSGDTLDAIARRHGVGAATLARANGLRDPDRLEPGQELRLPGAAAAAALETAAGEREERRVASLEASAAAPTASGPVRVPPAPAIRDPAQYEVAPDGTIAVETGETIGHLAEWLELRASDLRRLNRIRYGTPLPLGRRVKLDFSRVPRTEFVRRRLEYHRALQEDFFSAYRVAGVEEHVLREGDSVWTLSRRDYEVPVWLLRQYNPGLEPGRLRAGQRINIPLVEPRKG